MCLNKLCIDNENIFKEDHNKFDLYVYRFEMLTTDERFIFIGVSRDTKNCFIQHKRLLINGKHYNDELLEAYIKNKEFLCFNFYLIDRTKSNEVENRKKAFKLYLHYKNNYHDKTDKLGRKIKIINRYGK